MSTKERLAEVLDGAGLLELARRARAGEYDDFESDSATPQLDLFQALMAVRHLDLAKRVTDGEWDGTPEEADAWAQSEEGFRALYGGCGCRRA